MHETSVYIYTINQNQCIHIYNYIKITYRVTHVPETAA